MNRTRARRKLRKLERYEARYIRPPHGLTAARPLQATHRATFQLWGVGPWTSEHAILHRYAYRTTRRPR